MTVVSVLRLPSGPEARTRLCVPSPELEIFRHSRESGGFLGGRLLRPRDGGTFLVIAEWESDDAYRRWLDNPVREELGAHLEPLLAGDIQPGELYEDG